MSDGRIGLWLIGALGGVGSSVAFGLAALRRRLIDPTGLVTALPQFSQLNLDDFSHFVLGGHDIRVGTLVKSVESLNQTSNVFRNEVIQACRGDLEDWSRNVRPGVVWNDSSAIAEFADRPDLPSFGNAAAAIEQIKSDLSDFVRRNQLSQLVVVNVASTEPFCSPQSEHGDLIALQNALASNRKDLLPVSSLYAWAAIDLGFPFINFTPSTGANLPAIKELALNRRVPIAGSDGKTGETLLKTVLAPMFARRNLRILSWVGHNILGNRDGKVLNNPNNKATKLKSKDQVVSQIVGYSPQTHTSIEFIESLDDWKTAWDHVHFEGFFGVKMTMQVTWQGCDSILAAPLVLDLARLTLDAQRRGMVGILPHLDCFFKSPMSGGDHDFFRQCDRLDRFLEKAGSK